MKYFNLIVLDKTMFQGTVASQFEITMAQQSKHAVLIMLARKLNTNVEHNFVVTEL